MTCRRRKHTLAYNRICVRASIMIPHDRQFADALQRGEDTTSCGLRVAHISVVEKSVIKQ